MCVHCKISRNFPIAIAQRQEKSSKLSLPRTVQLFRLLVLVHAHGAQQKFSLAVHHFRLKHPVNDGGKHARARGRKRPSARSVVRVRTRETDYLRCACEANLPHYYRAPPLLVLIRRGHANSHTHTQEHTARDWGRRTAATTAPVEGVRQVVLAAAAHLERIFFISFAR